MRPTWSAFVLVLMSGTAWIGCANSGDALARGTPTSSSPTPPVAPPGPATPPPLAGLAVVRDAAPLVVPAPTAAATAYVSPSGSDNNPGTQAQPWQSLQFAFDQLSAGDVLEVMDGTYAVTSNTEIHAVGAAAAPVIIRSTSGQAIVDGSGMNGSTGARDALYLSNAAYVLIHGLQIRNAPRSGVRVSLSDHVTIQAVRTGPNGRWGIFTDYSDDLQLLGNECFGSAAEHGIYHSNSADRALIRGNSCHDNAASGIQINADPALPGDGIATDSIVEDNVCARNGRLGGAAINLASVRRTTVRNNILLGNLASGIALWDDGFSPSFGSRDNRVLHNTVVFASGEGRHCIVSRNGSTGNRFENNILVGGRRGCFELTTDSLTDLVADSNLLFSRDGWPLVTNDASGQTYDLAGWRGLIGGAASSIEGLPVFIDAANGNYGLAIGSPGRDVAAPSSLGTDLFGAPRPGSGGPDIGALER